MLKIKKIDEIPPEVKKIVESLDSYEQIYECEGMFGCHHTDYLIVIREEDGLQDSIHCYGYVYNGAEPSFSEFGSFGLNSNRTERVW